MPTAVFGQVLALAARRYTLPAAAEDEPPGAVEHAAGAVAAVGEVAESAGEAEPESAGAGSTPAAEL